MQVYESISLREAWWNICCLECGEPIADGPYRNVKITWAEILDIAISLWGSPDAFFVRDFLISMEFLHGKALLAFCSQGPRRGEVEISVPAGDEEARKLLKAFMDEVRAVIEADVTPPDQEWLCRCGHYQEDSFHCDACGAEPPWGCDCSFCQDRYIEDDEYNEYPEF